MTRPETRLTVRVLATLAALLVTASLSSCATLQLEQPTVRLAGITLQEVGLLQQVYGLTLQVDNPNDFVLPVKGVQYSVRLAGQEFASGLTPQGFSIPANASDQVRIEVRTNLLASLGQLSRLLADGTEDLDYEMSGKLRIDLPLIGSIPFSRSGTIPLTSAP